jgi:hypothetical protein
LHEGEVVEAEFVVRGQALPVRDSRPSCPQ